MIFLKQIGKLNLNFTTVFSSDKLQFFSTSLALRLNLSWRRSKKLPLNPMDRGILTDGADYVFLDGRPTPFGMRRKRKLLQQREYAKKIVELTESLDLAKERYANKIKEKDENVKSILDKKLQIKGAKLIVKK